MATVSFVWLVCACTEEPRTVQQPQLLLRVHSTPEVREAMDSVRITAAVEKTPGADGGVWTVRKHVDVPVDDRAWPIDIPVVPKDGDSRESRFELVIEALDGNDVLVQARAITRWFDDGVRILDVWLLRCGTAVLGELCEDDPECHGDACSVCIDPIVGLCGFVEEVDPDTLELLGLEDGVPVDLLWPPEFPLDAGEDATVDAGSDAGQRTDSGVARDAGSDPCAELDCDDDNPCTVDTCSAEDGCDNDGTGVTIDCAPDDNCNSGYVCQGDQAGTCTPLDTVDCSPLDDDCQVGVCDLADGSCDAQTLPDDMVCEDGDACTEGESCQDGLCGGGSNRVCDDSNPCTTDSCDAIEGCLRVNTDVPTCSDDDPCTVGDHCSSGLCTATGPRACGDGNSCTDDSCNSSDNDGDPCLHVNNAATCNDGNTCTPVSMCVGGSCIGSGNACGANALVCTPGSPNDCMCMTNYVDNGAGQCVPTTNECTMNICSASANCTDPSSALGNVQCSCPVGFTGDGRVAGTGCTDVNECMNNPCGAGRGSCTQGVPGTYSCNCNSGYTTVNGTCACDLNGTFAVRIDATLSWTGDSTTEASGAGGASQYLWARWQVTYGANGTLNATIQPCGSTSVDLCATVPTIGSRAYAQWVPVNVWNTSAGANMVTVNDVEGTPGTGFATPMFASLVGISLTDPLGAWPSSRAQVNGSVNGATWVDVDSDSKLGVTSYATPPGGITPDGSPPDPPETFASTSPACPRLSAAARWAYAYYPAVDGLNIWLVKRFQMAARTTGFYDAQITSCNRLDGSVGGPDQTQLRSEVRIGGCVRVNGAGELDCNSTTINFFDGTAPIARYVAADFTAVRVPNGTTCDQVRATSFP